MADEIEIYTLTHEILERLPEQLRDNESAIRICRNLATTLTRVDPIPAPQSSFREYVDAAARFRESQRSKRTWLQNLDEAKRGLTERQLEQIEDFKRERPEWIWPHYDGRNLPPDPDHPGES